MIWTKNYLIQNSISVKVENLPLEMTEEGSNDCVSLAAEVKDTELQEEKICKN